MKKNIEFSHPSYRKDIDGLRALAVLSVVIFHAFPDLLKGGFVGVDVFFVISGYLISTIILMNLDKGTFQFFEFYARRIKRIFPALLLVLVSCCFFGWFILLTDEYLQLGKHVAAGAAFISNYVFWSEVNYFDNSAETKPLLHLWSLGIEEQFYIVWPLVLWFTWKKNVNILTVTVFLIIVSFYLNLKGIKTDAVADFYSPQTRFWELLCGSLLAWVGLYGKNYFSFDFEKIENALSVLFYRNTPASSGHVLANFLSCTGVFLLVYGIFSIDKNHAFPGKWALLPVVGTMLIIAAGSQAWLNRVVFSNKLAIWFGAISFPLYLWHWPLLSFARIVATDTPTVAVRIGAVVLAVILAWMTYRFIESPIRKKKVGIVNTLVFSFLMLLVGGAGYYIFKQEGLPERTVVQSNMHRNSGEDGGAGNYLVNECGLADDSVKKKFLMCTSDSRGAVKYALMGDSKAHALFPGLIRTSEANGHWLFIGGHGPNGAPIPLLAEDEKLSNPLTLAAVDAISRNKDIQKVLLVTAARSILGVSDNKGVGSAYSYNYDYLDNLNAAKNYPNVLLDFDRVIKKFTASGKKVILLVDNPVLPESKDCIFRKTSLNFLDFLTKKNANCNYPLEAFQEKTKLYRNLLTELKAKNPGMVEIFDPTETYCDKTKGVCSAEKNDRIMYSYTDHISDYASGLVGKKLNDLVNAN